MAVTTVLGRYTQHTAADDVTTGRMHIKSVIWHGFTTKTHTLQIKDGDGTIIMPAVACGATTDIDALFKIIPLDIWVDGVETDVLGSGIALYMLG